MVIGGAKTNENGKKFAFGCSKEIKKERRILSVCLLFKDDYYDDVERMK